MATTTTDIPARTRRPRPPTWAQLVKREPLLGALEASIREVRPMGPHYCANARWYGYNEWRGRGMKPRLERLVGWVARCPDLRTSEAYDVAYRHLYKLLPDCLDCLCVRLG